MTETPMDNPVRHMRVAGAQSGVPGTEPSIVAGSGARNRPPPQRAALHHLTLTSSSP